MEREAEIANYTLGLLSHVGSGMSLVRPILFSQYFNVAPQILKKAGLLDPLLNADTKLFIDPLLIKGSKNRDMSVAGYAHLKAHFEKIIRLLDVSEGEGDAAWRAAERLLSLQERPETGLGYGGSSTSGSSRSAATRRAVLRTATEIIRLGVKDPEIISLMGLFDEGVGPDTISDTATSAILPVLGKITEEFCSQVGIKTQSFPDVPGCRLPQNPLRSAPRAVILVPEDVLRDLPLAADWSDVDRVVSENKIIRDAVNKQIADITTATLTEKKRALRKAALASEKRFNKLFRSLVGASQPYDRESDELGFYAFRELLAGRLETFKTDIVAPKNPSAAELRRVVGEIVAHFKFLVEKNNLWELLWGEGKKPRREKAGQLLFFGVADMFCRANNIDISPETHSGGGPVDFKFSSGYANRLLVEVKLSKGQVVHGYKSQLETYKEASQTDAGVFLVIDVGGMGKKLSAIKRHQQSAVRNGDRVSEIVVVDARRKPSASVAGRKSFGSG